MEDWDFVTVNGLTKKFKNERGVFDISFDVKTGETFGIIGESGAGKSTIIRLLMGFLNPTSGHASINSIDCYKHASDTKDYLSYLPGEFNLFDLKSGTEFLKYLSKLNDAKYNDVNSLIKRFQLDINAYPKRMSKGMKQKMALVSCFMKDVPLYILDEPSIGLDPLMREELMEVILDFKSKEKTIILSTNSYVEVERLCDKVLVISQGKIIDLINLKEIKESKVKHIRLKTKEKIIDKLKRYEAKENKFGIDCYVKTKELGNFFNEISEYQIDDLEIIEFKLEDYIQEKMEPMLYEEKKTSI